MNGSAATLIFTSKLVGFWAISNRQCLTWECFRGLVCALGTLVLVSCMPTAPTDDTTPIQTESADVDFGPDDTLGAVNYITPEVTLEAMKLVRQGKSYSLGVVIDESFPSCCGRSFRMTITPYRVPRGLNHLHGNDERIESHIGIGTQIDGFGHAAKNGVHYNGFTFDDVFAADGLKKFGVDTIPPIVTRGVLLDMTALNNGEMLPGGFALGSQELKAIAEDQGVKIRTGDVVLLHTGWLAMAKIDPDRFVHEEPGITPEGAEYLADLGVVAVGADTSAVDVKPEIVEGESSPVHTLLLVERGVHLLENIKTDELAADKAYEFLFVLGPPRIKGAPQGMINPVAIR